MKLFNKGSYRIMMKKENKKHRRRMRKKLLS
jgi:hypothetical protein